jgi:hypothetical protein
VFTVSIRLWKEPIFEKELILKSEEHMEAHRSLVLKSFQIIDLSKLEKKKGW